MNASVNGVEELSETERMLTNGGGATEEYGRSIGVAMKEAVIGIFQPACDWWYGV
jgi:hypothetical protein